jgi:hypothetical protein
LRTGHGDTVARKDISSILAPGATPAILDRNDVAMTTLPATITVRIVRCGDSIRNARGFGIGRAPKLAARMGAAN